MTVFLAAAQPRWTPLTYQDVLDALSAGLLEESHHIDMKREVGDTPGARKETARDIASFALDGGALLIGLEEDKPNRQWVPADQVLANLGERLEQIATQVVDPPVFTETRLLPSPSDPTKGFAFTYIPPSAVAPHMVDGVYYGRGDKTRVRLSDAQVVRHHAQRESQEAVGERLLDEEVGRDPVPVGQQQAGRLYAVAQPLSGRRDLAVGVARGPHATLLDIATGSETVLPRDVREFAPQPSAASHRVVRANGTALCSGASTGPGRTFAQVNSWTDETNLLDIEFREDGGVRLLMGRMTDIWGPAGEAPKVIADGLAVAYAFRLISWALAVGDRTDYRGSWLLGLHAQGLRGLMSSALYENRGWGEGPTYDLNVYRDVTTATYAELQQQPWAVAERLVGRLVRGLGSQQRYGKLLIPPDASGSSALI